MRYYRPTCEHEANSCQCILLFPWSRFNFSAFTSTLPYPLCVQSDPCHGVLTMRATATTGLARLGGEVGSGRPRPHAVFLPFKETSLQTVTSSFWPMGFMPCFENSPSAVLRIRINKRTQSTRTMHLFLFTHVSKICTTTSLTFTGR